MITEIRIRVSNVEKNKSKIKANVSVTLGNVFVIHDLKIVDGSKGLFVSMPGKRSKRAGKILDIAHPIDTAFRNELQDKCLAAYQGILAGGDVDYRKSYATQF